MHLRYFSCDKEKVRINVYLKKVNKTIDNVLIKDQASEDYFYGKDCLLEDKLGKLESATKKIYKEITELNILPKYLTKEHFILLLYVIFSKSRTLKQVEKLHESTNLIFQSFFNKMDKLKDIVPDYELHIEDPFWLIFKAASNSFRLAIDLEFKLLKNDTKKPFILSDNPVIYYNDFNNQKGLKITNGRGLACKGFQIVFPMSPNHLLFFYDPWSYKLGTKKSRIISISDEKEIDKFNILQILNSNEVLYFNSQVTASYLDELIIKSLKHDPFDNQELRDFESVNKSGTIIMMKNSSPNLKLNINSYKLQDRAKA